MLMDYLYDGSFEGLLTCIYHHYYREAADGIYPAQGYQPSLLHSSCIVTTDPACADRVSRGIRGKISPFALRLVYYAALSSGAGKENLILDYLRLGFRLGGKIDYLHAHPQVRPVHKLARLVGGEAHRLLGLLRFSDKGGYLYAPCSPDHAVLELLADHFADRLAAERWMIHDQKRNLAVIYDGQVTEERSSMGHRDRFLVPYPGPRWYLTDLQQKPESVLPEDDWYQELWKLYFRNISIETRYNPRLQAQFIPQRYRPHLTEFEK
jgi:probable DNA metabolism protein